MRMRRGDRSILESGGKEEEQGQRQRVGYWVNSIGSHIMCVLMCVCLCVYAWRDKG